MRIFKLAPTKLEDGKRVAVNPHNDDSATFMFFSDLADNPSEIVTGSDAGTLFTDFVKGASSKDLGSAVKNGEIPFSIASVTLNDGIEPAVHANPKQLKMFYVISAQPGAVFYYGLADKIEKDELVKLAKTGELTSVLKPVDVKPGMVFVIEPGLIYAAKGSMRLAEIAQSAADEAEMSLEQMLDFADLEPVEADFEFESSVDDGQASSTLLAECDAFTVFKTECHGRLSITTDDQSFGVLVMVEGSAIVAHKEDSLHVESMDTVFIKADSADVTVTGNCTYLYVFAD